MIFSKLILQKIEKDVNLITSTYLVFEYCEHDLDGMLMNNIRFNLPQIKRIMHSILSGLSELQKRNIIHRDIKPDNILYNKNKEIKVADFGLSKDLNIKRAPLSRKLQHMFYRAPESLFSSQHYSFKVDIWCAGIIFYQLLFRNQENSNYKILFPANNDEQLRQAKNYFNLLGNPEIESVWSTQSKNDLKMKEFDIVMSQITTEEKSNFKNRLVEHLRGMNPNVDDCALTLLSKMLALDPAQRYSADECLSHPFFSEEPIMAELSEMPLIEDGQEFHQMTQRYLNEKQNQELQTTTNKGLTNTNTPAGVQTLPGLGVDTTHGNIHLQQRRNKPQNIQNINRNTQKQNIRNISGNQMHNFQNNLNQAQKNVSPLPNQPHNQMNLQQQHLMQGRINNLPQRLQQQQNQQQSQQQLLKQQEFSQQTGFRKQQGIQNINQKPQNLQNKPFVQNEMDINTQVKNPTMTNFNNSNHSNFNQMNKNQNQKKTNIQNNNIISQNNNITPSNNNKINQNNQQINQKNQTKNNNIQQNNMPYKHNNTNVNLQLNNNNNKNNLNYSFQNVTQDNNSNNTITYNQNIFFINSQKTTNQNNISGNAISDYSQQENQQQQFPDYANSNFYKNQDNSQTTTQIITIDNKAQKNLDQSFQEDYQQNINNYSESTEVSNQDNLNNFKPQSFQNSGLNKEKLVKDQISKDTKPKYQQGQKKMNSYTNLPCDRQNGGKKLQEVNISINNKRKLSLQDNLGNNPYSQNKQSDQNQIIDEVHKKQKQNIYINTNGKKVDQEYVVSQQSNNCVNSQKIQQESTLTMKDNTTILSQISPISTFNRPQLKSLDLLQGSSFMKGMEQQQQLQQLNQIKNSTNVSLVQQSTEDKKQNGENLNCLQILAKIASEQNQIRKSSFTQLQNQQNPIKKNNTLNASNLQITEPAQVINESLQQTSFINDCDVIQSQSKFFIPQCHTNEKSENVYPSTPDFSNQFNTQENNIKDGQICNTNKVIHGGPFQQATGKKFNKKQIQQQKRKEKHFEKCKKQNNKHFTSDQIQYLKVDQNCNNIDQQFGNSTFTNQFNHQQAQQYLNAAKSNNQLPGNYYYPQQQIFQNSHILSDIQNESNMDEEAIHTPQKQKCPSNTSSTIGNHHQDTHIEDNEQRNDQKNSQITQQEMIASTGKEVKNDFCDASLNTQKLKVTNNRKYSDNCMNLNEIISPSFEINSQFNLGGSSSACMMNNNPIGMNSVSIHHTYFGGYLQSPFHPHHQDYILAGENNIIPNNIIQSPGHIDIHKFHHDIIGTSQMEINSPFIIGGMGNYSMTNFMNAGSLQGDGTQID